jgi:hypothetical protein
LLFAQAILHCDSPILHFPLLLGWQARATMMKKAVAFCELGSHKFLPGLAWKLCPPDLSLPRGLK